ncbi:hypothetical protein RHMOL_Rhmol01G0282400 [Rhododendron molle]|uniref:Uncharacterized protein n=1 Tax=Rhododendron molle TaxID=49168 RepID=A0ACC0Q7R0_RHOML|nr:hypothetical protein RHMOL_Rhmol01G0282400 [Rhododendron molle]
MGLGFGGISLSREVFQCRASTGNVVSSTISTVQTCFGRFKFVWIIFKYKITKTRPQIQTDLDRLKHVWTIEMRT